MSLIAKLRSPWAGHAAAVGAPLTFRAFAGTDTGRVRSGNEDSVLLCPLGSSSGPADNLYKEGLLAVLADGMGGSNAGEVASRMACGSIASRLTGLRARLGVLTSTPGRMLTEAVVAANREILTESQLQPDLRGMGTTCVALLLQGRHAWMSYVGDSRLYLARKGSIYRMTEDHSVVFEMVKRGVLTAEGAHDHPDRNVLSRALGTKSQVEVSSWEDPFALEPGDRFLLCSDGLHDLVNDASLLDTMMQNAIPESVSQLLAAANARGGYDNISAIVVEVRGEPGEAPVAGTERSAPSTPPPTRTVAPADRSSYATAASF